MKWISVTLGLGALFGFVVWSLMGARVIAWWYEPPIKDAFSCASSVEAALSQFILMQVISAAVGSVVVLVAVATLRVWWNGRKVLPAQAGLPSEKP